MSALYQYSPDVKNYFPTGIASGKNGVTTRDDDIPTPPDSHDESIARQPNLAQMETLERGTINDLAPEDQKAGMFGLYYLIRDVIVSVAAFAGGFLWQLSPAVNLLTATACGVLGTLYFAIRGRDLKGS